MGLKDARSHAGTAIEGTAYDPRGLAVKGEGHFAYYSPSNNFVRLVPCGGKDKVMRAARLRLEERETVELTRLVINVDSDINADGTESPASPIKVEAIANLVKRVDATANVRDRSSIVLADGTEVSLVLWGATDADTQGLPNQQTLERLVCASICQAYPDRGRCVHTWLENRVDKPAPNVKDYSWSYMAGWYSDRGCDAFYKSLWSDNAIADALEHRLQESGIWQLAEQIAK